MASRRETIARLRFQRIMVTKAINNAVNGPPRLSPRDIGVMTRVYPTLPVLYVLPLLHQLVFYRLVQWRDQLPLDSTEQY